MAVCQRRSDSAAAAVAAIPKAWNPLASYAVLELPCRKVRIRHVAYDVPANQRKLVAQKLSQSSVDILSRTKR